LSAPTHHAGTATGLAPRSGAPDATTSALRAIADRIRTWLEMRERASADRDSLANMSDRELLDIGLDRASANAVADGLWMRDRPH
jgi:uncharacterized protein YjiS (DUF1127 family)